MESTYQVIGIGQNQTLNPEDISDESALYKHYDFNNKNSLEEFNINDAYKVAFLKQQSFKNLDQREHF